MRIRIIASFLMVILFFGVGAMAGTTGKVKGRVKDASNGEPLIGANVLLGGTNLGAATDIEGYYVILNVPPGTYDVIVSSVGYGKKTVTGISVSVDLTTTVDVELNPAVVELGEEVVVTAERQVIKKDLTSSETRVSSDQIKNLPVQEVGEVLALQAGVTVGRGGEIHIRGGRSSEVAYWIDGISVSDSYDNSQSVQVDNKAVQELQVISGTFNAEYGQAMSGIVNIVTKDGGQDLRGSVSIYTGDYLPSGDLFNAFEFGTDRYTVNKVRPADNINFEGSLSGPIPVFPEVTFYGSGRYYRTDGWLYGIRRYNPDGTLGDDAVVPMNNRTRMSGQGKLSYNFAPTMKLAVTGIGSDIEYRDYNHDWRLNPDGDVKKFERGYSISTVWTHTLSSSAFYTINGSHFYKRFKEYIYQDPFDSRHNMDPFATNRDSYEFIQAGTNNHRFRRTTRTSIGKIDYTDQVNRLHQMKAGVEGKVHELFLDDFSLAPVQINDSTIVPSIPDLTTPLREQYTEKPIEFSAYVQDKLEYENMVVNIGVRFDYFNSKGKILADLQDPNVYLPQKPENQALTLDQRMAKWYKDGRPKYSVSPRLGISYPVTDRGVLHFSYGHFLQIPSFIHLYQKPGYKVTTASGVQGVYGNPDLNPQKTIMYEFGLQQQVTDDMSFDVTAFYRDTRDWVSTSPQIPVRDPETATSYYTMFVNRDYANSRGVTFWLNKRPSDYWSFNFSYTFQIAEGNNSNADEEQAAQQANREPTRSLTALDWDQTHTLNLNIGLGGSDWGVTLLGRYGSGFPYTPVLNQADIRGEDASRVLLKNSRRRPAAMTVDLNAFKSFSFAPVNVSVFLKVFNLLDRRNELDIYGETGRSIATPRNLGAEPVDRNPGRVNTVGQFLNRANFFSEPREIQLGVEVGF